MSVWSFSDAVETPSVVPIAGFSSDFVDFSSFQSVNLPTDHQLDLCFLEKSLPKRLSVALICNDLRGIMMNPSNLILVTIIALLIAVTAYWFQTEGSHLLEGMRKSDRKPFMMNHHSW